MSRIYWDTMLFIYWIENNPQYAKRVGAIHARMEERGDQLITSAFTFGEILAGPYRIGAAKAANETRQLLQSVVSEVIPFTIEAANRYAQLRGTLRLAPADAIHLACAAEAGTDLFLTNDHDLVGKIVQGIQFIAPIETQLF